MERDKLAKPGREQVCVVIPFYNVRSTLRHAVVSVLNQSYLDWRLILLNDGSTDDSIDTIFDLVDNDRVFLVSDNTNRGLICRLNQMVELTDAPYIARMDADDLMHPDRLRLQIEAFRDDPKLDIVSTGVGIVDGNYRVMGVRSVERQPTISDFMKYGGLVHASCIFRREFLESNRYDPGFFRAEDRELFLRVIPDVHYHCITKPLYFCSENNRFNKRRYLESYRTERKVIRLHGRRLMGWPAAVFYLVRSEIKSLLLHIMGFLGVARSITRCGSGRYYGNSQSDLQGIVDIILAMSHKRAPLEGE